MHLEILSAVASRQGWISAPSEKANMSVVRADCKHWTDSKSHVYAIVPDAGGERGRLPLPPDV